MTSDIEKPIILLGAARSGTFLLSRSLSQHPDVAYISEPNYIWKAYNADLGHDMIPRSRCTDRVRNHIRSRFNEMRIQQGRSRFCEKTPANGMRLPFVLDVFPDAKLVHVVRDGRHCAISARRKFMGNVQKITTGPEAPAVESSGGPREGGGLGNLSTVIRRAKMRIQQGVPPSDLIHYVPKAVDSTLGKLGLKRHFVWGPEFPGIRQMMRTHPLIEICAIQWQQSVEGVLNTIAARPNANYYQVDFTRLLRDNEAVTREIFDFAELAQPASVQTLDARGFDSKRDPFETELSDEERQILMDRIASTLQKLEYI